MKEMKCKRCGEMLPEAEFRPLRLQRKGVCRACEYMDKYESEMRGRERRLRQAAEMARAGAPGFRFVRQHYDHCL